ncbi:SRPBCC domain-containing protein [Nonomuraea sp. NBC_01738]|uniref:SRPBCC family protein n=1 Tax=Nonomuraea sp. NBC_01738 TaxID=2976003 RepID=UPI002E11C3D9|nr:SRPBCC domain-containing protein [Nonomuraea sp. NBC_01738]
MGHEFRIDQQADLDATPEQVWEAIATGPGIDSWFMGRTQVDGDRVTTFFGDYSPVTEITASEPLKRFAHSSPPAEDGRFVAYEFLIEARSGTTVLRTGTSGFLPGDDWQDEFEAMTAGFELFFATLTAYLGSNQDKRQTGNEMILMNVESGVQVSRAAGAALLTRMFR